MSPTISSLSRSSRSTLTLGCVDTNELSASGRNSVSAFVLERTLIWPASPPAYAPRSSRSRSAWRKIARACCNSVRPAWVGVTPCRPRTSSAAPSASSMLRMRVLAAASARCARVAPPVMLPASTTWRNRLRSVRSKRMVRCGQTWLVASICLRIRRRKVRENPYCPQGPEVSFSPLTKARTAASEWIAAGETEKSNGRNQGARRAAALSPSLHLQADADDDDVHRPSHHRCRSLFRHAAAGLVADRGGIQPQRLCRHRVVHELVRRATHPVRLHLGAHASHAGRHPTPDLGYRARLRPPRARMADGGEPRRVDQSDRHHLDRRLPVHGRAALMA